MYRFEEHTGEVRVRLRAEDFPGLLLQAALALAQLLTGSTRQPQPVREEGEAIDLSARDREGLLVDWLNELIFLTDTTGKVFTDCEFEAVDGTSVRGTVWGQVPETTQTAVKAATFHGLAIEEASDGRLEALVILDV